MTENDLIVERLKNEKVLLEKAQWVLDDLGWYPPEIQKQILELALKAFDKKGDKND